MFALMVSLSDLFYTIAPLMPELPAKILNFDEFLDGRRGKNGYFFNKFEKVGESAQIPGSQDWVRFSELSRGGIEDIPDEGDNIV
jgi:hypothetical protein